MSIQTKENLKVAIRATGKIVTMRDVAKASGFSPTTVSIALNDAPLARFLPEETKTKIRITAETLGYRPNPFARSLLNQKSQMIGLMVFDLMDPYCTRIVRGIESKLYESSYMPIFTDAHNDVDRFQQSLDMLLDRRVDALIILANWLALKNTVLDRVEQREIPKVLIGSGLSGSSFSSVAFDNEKGAYLAARHLYEYGHREIAILRGPAKLWDTTARWKGIQSFAQEYGHEFSPDLIVDLPDSETSLDSFEGGVAAVQSLLDSGKRFTAVMAFDDLNALGAIRALHRAGLRVPEDCSVIGFDDIPAASYCSPGLTTIRQPMERMGAEAVDIVFEHIRNGSGANTAGQQIVRNINAEVVVRESTISI